MNDICFHLTELPTFDQFIMGLSRNALSHFSVILLEVNASICFITPLYRKQRTVRVRFYSFGSSADQIHHFYQSYDEETTFDNALPYQFDAYMSTQRRIPLPFYRIG